MAGMSWRSWVAGWRGGWQLCAPTTGQPDHGSPNPAFHGAASQTAWRLIQSDATSATFSWTDAGHEFALERTWSLLSGARVEVTSRLENLSSEEKSFGVAEHLIFGSDLLGPALADESPIALDYSAKAQIHELDYSGAPTGQVLIDDQRGSSWRLLDAHQQPRVFALSKLDPNLILLSASGWKLAVLWQGLSHALIWQEFAKSEEPPWNGQVLALGIEPTTTPHGVGSAAPGNPVIAAGAKFAWSTTLIIEEVGDSDGR